MKIEKTKKKKKKTFSKQEWDNAQTGITMVSKAGQTTKLFQRRDASDILLGYMYYKPVQEKSGLKTAVFQHLPDAEGVMRCVNIIIAIQK